MSTSRTVAHRGGLLLAAAVAMLLALATLWLVSAQRVSAQEAQCDRPTAGLVSQWKGEGNANDSIGSNHGQLNGARADAQGIVGQAFWFDHSRTDFSLKIPDPLENTSLNLDYVTVEMWVKRQPMSTSQMLIEKRAVNSGHTGEYAVLMRPDGEWQAVVDTGAPNYGSGGGNSWLLEDRTTATFPLDTWTHFAMTWDGSAVKGYINGQLAGTGNLGTGVLSKNSEPIFFDVGLADEITLYSRALSLSEIQAIYCGGNPPGDSNSPPDNTAPEKPTVDLGSSNTGNTTNDDTPTFSGTAEPEGTVKIYDGDTLLGEAQVDNSGNWSFTVPPEKALTDGTHQITVSVTDGAGNTSPLSDPVTITVDTKNPLVECATADALWHKADVSIACTASDDGSGLADAADASFSLSTNVANGTETNDAQTGSRQVCDKAGNCATAGPIAGNKVDKKAPSVTISTPADGAEYRLGQAVASEYSCSDGGTGLASCSGPVSSGTNIDTATVGSKSFAVEATDEAGNLASKAHAYSVVYDFGAGSRGFLPPIANYPDLNEMKAGGTVPVKFSLGGDFGLDIFASGYPLSRKISCETQATVEPVEELVTASNSGLKYDATTDQYSYNWKTEKAWSGTCRRLVLKLNDGSEHPVNFKLK